MSEQTIDQKPTAGRAQELVDAGARAEDVTLWSDAVDAYEQVLSLIAGGDPPDGIDEAEVLVALGRCYWNLSEARTAWRTLRRAITLYQQRGDGVGQARATVELLRIWGPPDRHREMAQAALEALGDGDPYLRARLLLRLRWLEDEESFGEKFEEAMAIGERYGYEEIVLARKESEAWRATDEGRIEDGIALREELHQVFRRLKIYDAAAGVLRGSAFSTLEFGMLDRGYELAEQCFRYASEVHLAFTAQLALMDMAAVHFARGEYDRCEQVLGRSPGDADFRADLYRMWIAEARGDTDTALRLLVDPARGGRSPGAEGQIHAAAADVLYHAGKTDAAAAALQRWAQVREQANWPEDYCFEAPATMDTLLALGDDALLRKVHDAFRLRDERIKAPMIFSTLQGRAAAPVRGAVAERLGLRDEAARIFRDGLAWCEQERCLSDAELCRAGLARVAGAAG